MMELRGRKDKRNGQYPVGEKSARMWNRQVSREAVEEEEEVVVVGGGV